MSIIFMEILLVSFLSYQCSFFHPLQKCLESFSVYRFPLMTAFLNGKHVPHVSIIKGIVSWQSRLLYALAIQDEPFFPQYQILVFAHSIILAQILIEENKNI